MNFNQILSTIGNLAKQVLPAVVPGAGPALAGAKALSEAFQSFKTANGGTAPADAEVAHDALFERVKAHAESTFDRLEGNG